MKRALLIGIRATPNIPREYGTPLRGCHNDVERMSDVLEREYSFDDVRVLVDRLEAATDETRSVETTCACKFCNPAEEPGLSRAGAVRLVDSLPTRRGIRDSVRELTEDVQEDDVVVFYYSGHGSEFFGSDLYAGHRFQTIVAHDSGRGQDELGRQRPNRDVFDTEIDLWLRALNEKTPYVTAIFDSCHSGGVADPTRSAEESAVRRIDADERPTALAFDGDAPVLRPSTGAAGEGQTRGGPDRREKGPSGWIRTSSTLVLAACRARQLSRETEAGGKYYGSFTYHLAESLERGIGKSWSQVFTDVLEAFRNGDQQPQREGDGPVFDRGELRPNDVYPPVIVSLKRYAVVIGIDYTGREAEDEGRRFPRLHTPVRDAREVASTLRESQGYEIVGLEEPEPLLNEQATRKNIHAVLGKLAARKVALRRNTAVLLYFAGHGEVKPDDRGGYRGYLVPWDAIRGDNSTWIPMTDLRDQLKDGIEDPKRLETLGFGGGAKALPRLEANHLFLVLDCCFAGAMSFDWFLRGRVPERPIYYSEYKRYVEGTAWQLLSSATLSQRAFDVDPRNTGETHSPFAQAFLEGVSTENADGLRDGGALDHIITASELHQHIDRRLHQMGKSVGAAAVQTPSLMDLKPKTGEYFFTVPGWSPRPELDPPLEASANPWWGDLRYESRRSRAGSHGVAESQEDPLFFGQQRNVLRVLDKLLSKLTRPLVIAGSSASGKSSLVRAGLLPLLEDPVAGRQRVRMWLNKLGWDRFLLGPDELKPLKSWALAEGLDLLMDHPERLARRVREIVERLRTEGLLDIPEEAAEEQVVRTQAERLGVDVLIDRSVQQDRLRLAKRLRLLDLLDSPAELAHQLEFWVRGVPEMLTASEDELRKLVGEWRVAILALDDEEPLESQLERVQAAIRDDAPGVHKLLFIDALEKLLGSTEISESHLGRLREWIREGPRRGVQVLATLRTDVRGRGDGNRRFEELLQAGFEEIRLVPPRYEDLRQMIERPAQAMSVTFEPSQLVEDLIEEARRNPAPLPLLSIALSRTFDAAIERRRAAGSDPLDRSLTSADLRSAGGVSGWMQARVESLFVTTFEQRPDSVRRLRRLFLRFLDLADDGALLPRRVPWDELVFRDSDAQRGCDEVLEILIRSRVLVADESGCQLAAPSLVGWTRLTDWIETRVDLGTDERVTLSVLRELGEVARRWADRRFDAGLLWDVDPRLPAVLRLAAGHRERDEHDFFNRVEESFLDESELEWREAVVRRVADSSSRTVGGDWNRGALLAVESARVAVGFGRRVESLALQALHEVLARTPLSIPIPVRGAITGVRFSEDERWLFVGTSSSSDGAMGERCVTWATDLETLEQKIAMEPVDVDFGRVASRPASAISNVGASWELAGPGGLLARNSSTRNAIELSIRDGSAATQLFGHGAPPDFVGFSPQGGWMATAVSGDSGQAEVRLWRRLGGGDLSESGREMTTEVFAAEPAIFRGDLHDDVAFGVGEMLIAPSRLGSPVTWKLNERDRLGKVASRGTDALWSAAALEGVPGCAPRLWVGSSSGGELVVTNERGSAVVLDAPEGAWRLQCVSQNAEVVVASNEELGPSGGCLLWDRRGERPERRGLPLPTPTARGLLAVSRDGAWLAAAAGPGANGLDDRVWIAESSDSPVGWKELSLESSRRGGGLSWMSFHPSGQWLAGLSHGGRAHLWSVSAGALVEPRWPEGFDPQAEVFTALTFSGDGRWLGVGSVDGDVLLIDVSGDVLAVTPFEPGVAGAVERLAFDGASRTLAVGARSTVSVWRVDESRTESWSKPVTLHSERRRGFRVHRIAFSERGDRLAALLRDASTSETRVVVHRLDLTDLMKIAIANAGRRLTSDERKRFLPEDFEARVPLMKETGTLMDEARSLHRAIVLGSRVRPGAESLDQPSPQEESS